MDDRDIAVLSEEEYSVMQHSGREEIVSYLREHPDLKISEADTARLISSVKAVSIEEGDILVNQGDSCLYLPIVLRGSIKVTKVSQNAREVVLYYINTGGSCILSALGILNSSTFPANALCDRKANVLLIPSSIIREFVHKYEGWRNFVFKLYNSRFNHLLCFIDEILFSKLDVRLVRHLLTLSGSDSIIRKTHQQLAEELGSTREVISRILKDMEKNGHIALGRGSVSLLEPEKIKKKYLL
ncbi:MAG: Crp/Fnr family transcriptional regulator [Spirochaetales bacterium]|nr:Crp/Fnr family transcriptional regulator [Spirochaetales bacterium]